jgi:uncharacterized protein with HEPN domain
MNKDLFFLEHILEEIRFLEGEFPKNSREELQNDPVLQRATLRSLEIIGNSVKYLSLNFKAKNPEVEWKDIAEMGDDLIYSYSGTDWDIVYEIVVYALPELKIILKKSIK